MHTSRLLFTQVSSNYLEALERWDTGAVQLLVAQGLGASWLWQSIALMLCIEAAIIIPAFVPPVEARRRTPPS